MLSCRGVVAAAVDLVSDVATNDVSRSLARFGLFFFAAGLCFVISRILVMIKKTLKISI